MDEFETVTDVDFDTDESTDCNKVAIIALAGTALVAAGTLAVVKYRSWRASKVKEIPTEEKIIEIPEAPEAPEE